MHRALKEIRWVDIWSGYLGWKYLGTNDNMKGNLKDKQGLARERKQRKTF